MDLAQIVRRLQELPGKIQFTASTGSDSILYFINLKQILIGDETTRIEAEPFRKALAQLSIKYDKNGVPGGMNLLINAIQQLEDMHATEIQQMIFELERVIQLAELAISSSDSLQMTLNVPKLSIRQIQLGTSKSQITLSRKIESTPSASTSNQTVPSGATNQSSIPTKSSLKRTALGGNYSTLMKKAKKNLESDLITSAAMIGHAILSSPSHRANCLEVLQYLRTHFAETIAEKTDARWKLSITRLLERRDCFQKLGFGPKKLQIHQYYKIVEGNFMGPFDPIVRKDRYSKPTGPPESWQNIVFNAIAAQPERRITSFQLIEYVRKEYTYYRAKTAQQLGNVVSSKLSLFCNKGEVAPKKHSGGYPSCYYHLKEAATPEPEEIEEESE